VAKSSQPIAWSAAGQGPAARHPRRGLARSDRQSSVRYDTELYLLRIGDCFRSPRNKSNWRAKDAFLCRGRVLSTQRITPQRLTQTVRGGSAASATAFGLQCLCLSLLTGG